MALKGLGDRQMKEDSEVAMERVTLGQEEGRRTQ